MADAPLMLSVSGLRGLVGQSLTPPVAARYAAAFGQWLKSASRYDRPPHVVLGRDSRPSGQMFELAAAAGLIGVGCRVTCLGIATTPCTAVMTEHLGADGGMVITASHNPIEWNGLKALCHDGAAPPPDQASQIIERFSNDLVDYADAEFIGPLDENHSAAQVHTEHILHQIDADLIRQRPLKLVLDSAHGAGGPATAVLARQLGVDLVHLHAEPTGRFPHPPEPTRENLDGLCDAVRQHHADVGFAQDPDADRLAIVDESGRYIGEEYTLALCCLHLLSRRQQGDSQPVLATNLSTSRMIDDVARQHGDGGGRVVRTPVGEANVAAAMLKHKALIGGEGNGGVILPGVCHVRDSLVAIALVLEMIANRKQPLSSIVDQIPHYAMIKQKLDLPEGPTEQVSSRMRQHFVEQGQKVDLQDGVRVDWSDRWVHVRPSNTEPILRIIAEAPHEQAAWDMINEVRHVLGVGPV